MQQMRGSVAGAQGLVLAAPDAPGQKRAAHMQDEGAFQTTVDPTPERTTAKVSPRKRAKSAAVPMSESEDEAEDEAPNVGKSKKKPAPAEKKAAPPKRKADAAPLGERQDARRHTFVGQQRLEQRRPEQAQQPTFREFEWDVQMADSDSDVLLGSFPCSVDAYTLQLVVQLAHDMLKVHIGKRAASCSRAALRCCGLHLLRAALLRCCTAAGCTAAS